ncbi:hypothetical protein F5Y14DRAFT_428989 [Nemania sp. NC0429]|nr:hypothetical protein F5Y14DRAFT_428989 [Nemania sp. NC0429]
MALCVYRIRPVCSVSWSVLIELSVNAVTAAKTIRPQYRYIRIGLLDETSARDDQRAYETRVTRTKDVLLY